MASNPLGSCWPYSPETLVTYLYSYVRSVNQTDFVSPIAISRLLKPSATQLGQLGRWCRDNVEKVREMAVDVCFSIYDYAGDAGLSFVICYFFVLLLLGTFREFMIVWKQRVNIVSVGCSC